MDLPAGSVTFLLTDIEGSTRLWEEHPHAMRRALGLHDVLAREVIAPRGRLLKERGEGDSLFAVFARPGEAVDCALTLQQSLLSQSWPTETPLRVRMALHTGEAEAREGDYYGPGVNRCARLRSAAHGGQVLLSRAVAELLDGTLPEGASLRDLGTHRLRDLHQPEHVWQLLHPDLPDDFPPLLSLDTMANNLPRQLTSFIGRGREISEVRRLLSTTRLLTLTGPGGCGKTRLALQVAAETLDRYPDGTWFADLSALAAPALIVQVTAAALDVREEPGRPLQDTLTGYLGARSPLLVLDNCEHLLPDCARFADTLLRDCPNLRILATSREALNIAGERTYPVPNLTLPETGTAPSPEALKRYEATALFAERALFALPSFTLTDSNAPAVAQVCERLDGIPLAIELAAARVRALTPRQIAERLDDRFRLLTGGSRADLPRHQTLRALIDWSYNLLSEPERALLRRLSVFAGGWTLEAAETICTGEGIETGQVLGLLTSLADKSLVIVEPREENARYRLLETVRQYGLERLRESGEEETARGRHLGHFLGLAEVAEPHLRGAEQVTWFNRLEEEHDNLRAAMDRAAEGEKLLRLAGALAYFWYCRSHYGEGRQRLEDAIAREKGAPSALRAKARSWAGTLAWLRDDWDRSEELQEQALTLFQEAGDRWNTAFTLSNLAIPAYHAGEYPRTVRLVDAGLDMARQVGDPWLIALLLVNSGAFYAEVHQDYKEALAREREALALFQEMGDREGIGVSLCSLGCVALYQQDDAAARAYLLECLEVARELGDKRGIILTLCLLGQRACRAGDLRLAWSRFRECLAVSRDMGSRSLIAEALEAVAEYYCAKGLHERAARLMAAAEALREAICYRITPAQHAIFYDRILAETRDALGAAAFATAWKEGRALAWEQAIAFALEE